LTKSSYIRSLLIRHRDASLQISRLANNEELATVFELVKKELAFITLELANVGLPVSYSFIEITEEPTK
jgi:hypothetical protein